jgi:CheY-like chemotaxis protein
MNRLEFEATFKGHSGTHQAGHETNCPDHRDDCLCPEERYRKLSAAGMDGYVSKPFHVETLLKELGRVQNKLPKCGWPDQ